MNMRSHKTNALNYRGKLNDLQIRKKIYQNNQNRVTKTKPNYSLTESKIMKKNTNLFISPGMFSFCSELRLKNERFIALGFVCSEKRTRTRPNLSERDWLGSRDFHDLNPEPLMINRKIIN